MSYGLKQSQIIVKPLADATKGAIELNRDVTGNPTNNVILTDIYLGDNEHMIYDPDNGEVTGVVSHFKTGFVNGQLTSNSEYAVVAATLLGGGTASTFTPSYFQVGHFAVSAATITDFNGGTLILSAGESLGHIDLHDNMIVMHPQPASIASTTNKDMGFVFSRSSDTASMLFLDATNGEFYLKTVTNTGGVVLDVHDINATSGTLSLAPLHVGALYIGGTLVPTSYALGDLIDVDFSTPATSGQVLKYNGEVWAPANDDMGGGGATQLSELTDVDPTLALNDGEFLAYNGNDELWESRGVSASFVLSVESDHSYSLTDTYGITTSGTLSLSGSDYPFQIASFVEPELNYQISSSDGGAIFYVPATSDLNQNRFQKVIIQNTGDSSIDLRSNGETVFVSGSSTQANTYTVGAGESVTFLVGGGIYNVLSHNRLITPDYDVWTYTGGTFTLQSSGQEIAGSTINLNNFTPDPKALLYLGHSLEQVLLINNNTNTSTLNLYYASEVPAGTRLIIKNIGSQEVVVSKNITSSDTIDGETSISLPLQYSSVTLVCNGTNAWFIL